MSDAGVVNELRGIPAGDRVVTRNFDFSLAKGFSKPRERHNLQFRFESFTFTNTPRFGQPAGTLRATDTATIKSAGEPWHIQLGLNYVS